MCVLMCQNWSIMTAMIAPSCETLTYTNNTMHAFTPMKTFSCDRGHFRFQRALPLADLTHFANWEPHKHRKPLGPSLHKERKTKKGWVSLPSSTRTRMPRSAVRARTFRGTDKPPAFRTWCRALGKQTVAPPPHRPFRHHCLLRALSISNGHAHVGLSILVIMGVARGQGRAAMPGRASCAPVERQKTTQTRQLGVVQASGPRRFFHTLVYSFQVPFLSPIIGFRIFVLFYCNAALLFSAVESPRLLVVFLHSACLPPLCNRAGWYFG